MQPQAPRQLVLLTVLTALCIGLQLSPRPPNVEFTSLIVFLVGAVFGISFGVSLAFLVMFVNGFLSPWGFAGFVLPFQVAGMVAVGIGGGLHGRASSGSHGARLCVETAVLGAFLTLVYDMVTNLGVAASYALTGMPLHLALASTFISGALFSVIHVVSNAAVFGVVFVPLSNALRRLSGGGENWKEESLLT